MLPYSDIDSYSRSGGDIYLNHHNQTIPKLVLVKLALYRLKMIERIEHELQEHDIATDST